MKNKAIINIGLIILALGIFLNFAPAVMAADDAPSTPSTGVVWLGIPPQCLECGNCSMCDIFNVATNIGKFIIGIIGSILFVYFIYGGIWMLIAAGRANYIQKGKDILINSVIGLAIIFGAYLIVSLIVLALTGGEISVDKLVTPQLDCPEAPSCGTQK